MKDGVTMWEIVALNEAGQPREQANGFVAVTEKEIMLLERHPQNTVCVKARSRHSHAVVDKIVLKKSNPKHTTIRFTDGSPAEQFLVDEPAEIIKLVRAYIEKLAGEAH
jgi:hypothetical protein